MVISRSCFAEDGKEMYQNVKRMCRAIVFAHSTDCVVVAVTVVVCLSSQVLTTVQNIRWSNYPLPSSQTHYPYQNKCIHLHWWSHLELNSYLHPVTHSDCSTFDMLCTCISHRSISHDSQTFSSQWSFWSCDPVWHDVSFLSGQSYHYSAHISLDSLQCLTSGRAKWLAIEREERPLIIPWYSFRFISRWGT